MEFNRENIRKWLEEYFKAFNRNNGDPATVPNMEEYFTPDLQFISYILDVKRPDTRQGLLNTMVHPGVLEELTPEDSIIDEKRKAVAVILRYNSRSYRRNTTAPTTNSCRTRTANRKSREPHILRSPGRLRNRT